LQKESSVAADSTNYWELMREARTALAEKKWPAAKAPLNRIIERYPAQRGPESAYALLAAACRELNQTNEERQVLSKLAAFDADAADAFLRLMELGEAAHDWPAVTQNADRLLAVNPLLPQPYRCLARASEELDNTDAAIHSYQRLLLLDPPDPAEVHFALARLLRKTGDPSAKRHVLQALEEAPRFRAAQHLLLEIDGEASHEKNPIDPSGRSVGGGYPAGSTVAGKLALGRRLLA